MTDSPDIQYLKQDRIGKVIAKGLASVYQTKPDKPITYFANWLLNHSKNLKDIQSIKKAQEEKKVRLGEHLELEKQHSDQAKRQEQVRTQVEKKNSSFEDKIQNEKYHFELFVNELPEFLEQSLKLSGVYIGELNFPSKQVTDEDIDQNAHLNTEAPKLIKYIGSSKSHQALMKGKTLNAEKSVTGEVFVAAPPTTNEEGVEIPGEKPKYIYVSDVVQNDKIHYFKLPKLGAYLAVPLVYKSYLSQPTFNFVLEQTKKEEKEKVAFETEKTAQLEQLRAELEDAKGKLEAYIEKQGEASADVNKDEIPEYKDVKDLEEKVGQKQNDQFEYVQADIVSEVKEFVVCADTLGQDRQITNEEREFFLKYVDLFRNQWEECQLRLLKQDVDNQIAYEKSLRLPVNELIDETLQDIEEFPQGAEHDLNEKYKDNQKLLAFETSAYKLDQIRTKLETEEIQKAILVLNKFRVVRFPTLIQNILYFLGHKKEEIDIPGTTHLNWKYVRQNLINQKLIKNTLSYDYRGPKHQEFKRYEKIDSLLTALEKFPEQQVLEYNIGLGLLLKFVKAALKLRKEDIEIRRASIEELKRKREEKEKENEAIQEEKNGNLEKHKSGLAPEELENFNEEEWVLAYEEEHPFVEIPPEVYDDVDNDI